MAVDRIGEAIGCFHDDESRRGHEAFRFQEPIDAGLGDEDPLGIGEGDGDLARRPPAA
jgi:hypothetical protein